MTTDYNKTDGLFPTTRKLTGLDTIRGRHRVRFRSDHHTHQHTHCQQMFYKHHIGDRQAQYTLTLDLKINNTTQIFINIPNKTIYQKKNFKSYMHILKKYYYCSPPPLNE